MRRYKLDNGKYVAPAVAEEALMGHRCVTYAVMYGLGKPHSVAVIAPDFEALKTALPGAPHGNAAALCRDPAVQALYDAELPAWLEKRGVKKLDQPKRFLVVPEPFSPDNNLLTLKMSIRKPNVVKRYQAELDALYEK